MKNKIIAIFMVLVILMCLSSTIYANERSIYCSETVTGNMVQITGGISNFSQEAIITLLVEDVEKIVHIAQISSEDDGTFAFEFRLPAWTECGVCEYKIGSDADAGMYVGEFTYDGVTEVEGVQFLDADINVDVSLYVPTITGTIACMDGISAVFNIVNTVDQTTIASDSITCDDGAYEISYTLPSLARNTSYCISLVCYDGDESVLESSMNISSSILKIDASGNVNLADDVTLTGNIQTTNTGLIDKNIVISNDASFDESILNVALSMEFDFAIDGFIKRDNAQDFGESEYTIEGNVGDFVYLPAIVHNIESFDEKVFELEYSTSQLQLLSLNAICGDDLTDVGVYGNIEVLSNENGKITFAVKNIEIPSNKSWSGVMNIFKFKILENDSNVATVTLK